MSTKITSRAILNAGSLGRLPVKEGAEIGFGNLTREAVMGDEGVLGFSESYVEAPFIKCTVVHTNSTDEEAIKAFVGENITLTTNSDKVYTLMNAWTADPLSLTTKDGQIEVTFNGEKLIPQ